MGYNLKKIKAELVEKKLVVNGLVAWGQNMTGTRFWFGVLGSALAGEKKHIITKIGDKLAIIPFTSKAIEYNSAIGFDKSKITKAKVSGIGAYCTLKLFTEDGEKHEYNVSQGKKDVVEMLKLLGIESK